MRYMILLLALLGTLTQAQEYSKIVSFGDSWTDDNNGTPWVEFLARDLGIPLSNRAVAGATSGEIEQQAYAEINRGIDPNALYTYWIFPNDFYDYQDDPLAAIPIIERNAKDTFDALRAAGAVNFLVLTLPSALTIPIIAQQPVLGEVLLTEVDLAIGRAAGDVWMYESGVQLDQIEASGNGCWVDIQHFCTSTHRAIANGIMDNLPTASSSEYTLDLSGVSSREHMQDWDSNWISEYEEELNGYEWQVDPGNGGQVGVWTGSGNPSSSSGSNRDYSQFIAAGPPAGTAVTVRMKFEHRDDGSWVSSSHTDDSSRNRAHYEVALQSGAVRIYKFWGPDPGGDYSSVASRSFSARQGTVYWLYLTETRVGDAVNGAVTIDGELLDRNLNSLVTISVTDTGNLAGHSLIPSSNKRGFGSYSAADGNGAKIFEWSVEGANQTNPQLVPNSPTDLRLY